MIPPSAIKKFLERKTPDYRWLKDLTHKQLDALLDDCVPAPKPWSKLMMHQKACLYLGIKLRSFGFWCDMGVGKTMIALELLQYWWEVGELRRALIFVTSATAFSSWERQIKQYDITVPCVFLDAKSSDVKWEQLNNFGNGLVFLHYPGTVAQVCEKVRSKGTKKKLAVAPVKLKRLLDRVDALVLDESTKCGNHQSLTFQICDAASHQAKFRYALAGMPFGRDPALLWPQMYLVDHGETLGATLGLFREAFFTKKQNYWAKYSFDYTFKPKLQGTLSALMQNRSITYTAAECIELPAVSHIVESVRLSPEILEFYEGLVKEIIGSKHNMRVVKNAFLRMRQLSSGFLGLKDDDSGDKAEVDFDENPKLDRLLELIDALPADRKALVFYEFTHSGRRIAQELREAKTGVIWLWSGTKDAKGDIERFINEPDCRVAVINNKVGAYSLDGLQVANYEFHYETALSVIDRSQAEKRIMRQGQLRKCFMYDLVAEGTVDTKILDYHREGSSLFDALLANPEGLFVS